MTTLYALSFLIFLLGILLYYWVAYQPHRYIDTLVSKGAVRRKPENNPYDNYAIIKRDIQADPDMKAIVGYISGKVHLTFISTDLVKQILTNHRLYTKLIKGTKLVRLFLGNGISIAEGETWKLHRKIISSAFQYDFFKDMIPTIVETADDMLGIFSPTKKTILLPHDTDKITGAAITQLFFGVKFSDVIVNNRPASEVSDEMQAARMTYNTSRTRLLLGSWALSFIPDYRRQMKKTKDFRRVFKQKIQERIKELEQEASNAAENNASTKERRKDLLQILLQQRNDNLSDPAQTFSDDNIVDEFDTFFIAGKETTSLLISLSLYCCVKYPEWGDKLRGEIDETIKDVSQIALDQINSMETLSAFVNEVLRMYPPIPSLVLREANQDHYVGDFFVKKGTIVNTLFIVNSYNPKYFDDPEDFNPSRWFKANESVEKWKTDSFAYLSFSAGPRNCIGKQVALIQAKVVITLILKQYNLSIDPKFELKTRSFGIVRGPVEPIPFDLTPK